MPPSTTRWSRSTAVNRGASVQAEHPRRVLGQNGRPPPPPGETVRVRRLLRWDRQTDRRTPDRCFMLTAVDLRSHRIHNN